MRRNKRNKINLKRFTFSLTIFAIIFILIVNISKKIFAKVSHENKNYSSKEAEEYKNMEISNLDKEKIETNKEDDKINVEEDLKDIKEDNSNKLNDYKEIFKEDLFLGDSITDSISFYEFLDQSHVIAKFGLTAKGAKGKIEEIAKADPKNIFIMFGMNDILTGEDREKFIKDYLELIQSIKEKLPDVKIYIQSILPVEPKVKDKKPLLTNENINEFNQALMDMAEDEKIDYINIKEILEQNNDLLEPDGIHVKYKFYKLWLDYLVENIKQRG